jgi:hypothetical protein
MEIKSSNDYSKFESIIGNRRLNASKIEKICADVKNGFNMLPYAPIIVSDDRSKFLIVDGQHRFEVSKKLNEPVYYVVCDDITLQQIAILNSRADKWRAIDFLNCYVSLGITDYVILRDFMNKHKTNIKLSTDLLMFNSVKASSTEAFQSGKFECKYFDEAEAIVELTDSLFDLFVFSKDRYLIGAVQEIQNKGVADLDRLKTKIRSKRNMMFRQTDVKNYILNIEKIYNDGVQNRVLLT